MTDANLMDADCLHGNVWYECEICDRIDLEHFKQLQISEEENETQEE